MIHMRLLLQVYDLALERLVRLGRSGENCTRLSEDIRLNDLNGSTSENLLPGIQYTVAVRGPNRILMICLKIGRHMSYCR